MSIRASEEQLFVEWEAKRVGFVRDGVASEKSYKSSQPRIAFILKEVNDLGGGGWDLREFIYEGGRPQTWNNVSRWIHGIRNRQEIPEWKFYEEISEEFRKELLSSICAMNLKKSPGTHTTEYTSLYAVANEDKKYIQNQYSIYDPELTICCGTGELFKEVAEHESKEWKMTTRGIWWYERESGKFVISYAHPEARVQNSLLLYGLIDAVNEIYSKIS
tara:strand:+ start:2719 stop:3372 length:654 start_codon:yes stop_codon:yes gene_type:complete